MKFKYFLRGLGVGIVFASIVFLIAYQNNAAGKMTDAEIIKKAKELGMVEREDPLEDLLSTHADVQADNGTTAESTDNKKNDSEDTTEKYTEEETLKEEKEQTTEATTQAADEAEDETVTGQDTVTITIDGGSSSYPVSQKLQEAGLIEDASAFDTYLVENGYANRLRVGEHTLKKGMSYHDIAEAISDPL